MPAKKLTITVDEDVYRALHEKIGRRNISRFLTNLAKPYVLHQDLMEAYRQMGADELREAEAEEWTEGLIGDAYDEKR